MDIKIVLDVEWGDYIVPGIDGTEAQAYYTDDKEDAYDTARAIFGQDVFLLSNTHQEAFFPNDFLLLSI